MKNRVRRDLTGIRFGRLLVIGPNDKEGAYFWATLCDCGTIKSAYGGNLRAGNIKSCGCLKRENNIKRCQTHGKANHAEYKAWIAMRVRCYRKLGKGYPDYGGRGIKVCDRWLKSFDDFYHDMGPRPSKGHSIDRIDNNGNYEPSNCKWSTRTQQNNNTRKTNFITIDDISLPIQEWARRFNISIGAIQGRLKKGWSIEAAVKTPAWGRTRNSIEKSFFIVNS
jgi:hypothetical protein